MSAGCGPSQTRRVTQAVAKLAQDGWEFRIGSASKGFIAVISAGWGSTWHCNIDEFDFGAHSSGTGGLWKAG